MYVDSTAFELSIFRSSQHFSAVLSRVVILLDIFTIQANGILTGQLFDMIRKTAAHFYYIQNLFHPKI